jgi:threonine aldolase
LSLQPSPLIDFYSDTVTKPTAAMRRAMADAEVGDEQQREDPTVNRLQDMVAALLGKEAGLFLPSGTMCNQVAFAVHCRPGDEILLHETAHPLLYEAGGPAPVCGAVMRQLRGPRGQFTAADVRQAINPPVHYMPRSRVVSVEQTANIVGGACWPVQALREISQVAHDAGLVCHMDGARLLNAVVATGTSAAAFAGPFDSVWIDLTKGLGAPVGAVLAGSRDFVEQAWVFKQRFGGAMRQAGIVAAAGIYALEHHVTRMAEDHERAKTLARGLAEIPGIEIDAERIETNIVIFDIRGTGVSGDEFDRRTQERSGVRFSILGPTLCRAVTHLDLPADAVERGLAAAADALRGQNELPVRA